VTNQPSVVLEKAKQRGEIKISRLVHTSERIEQNREHICIGLRTQMREKDRGTVATTDLLAKLP
jgi:hypothetical protein